MKPENQLITFVNQENGSIRTEEFIFIGVFNGQKRWKNSKGNLFTYGILGWFYLNDKS